MFGFHKSKIYRSNDGCCICKTKSSSSRFTDSSRYEETFRMCFGLSEDRVGDICNACVLLVKRWKKLPHGSKKNWNHVVDARAGPGFKVTKPKKIKNSDGKKKSKLKKLHKFKRQNSDAHSTTSSMSPAQSPSYSNQSDDGSDIESKQRRSSPSIFSFLDRSYWKSTIIQVHFIRLQFFLKIKFFESSNKKKSISPNSIKKTSSSMQIEGALYLLIAGFIRNRVEKC
uniref:Sinhcafl antisense lncRNA n=1 Tax=Xiphophorus couchianus TaxID=32473 RepID=A0A3B5LS76_9TELE